MMLGMVIAVSILAAPQASVQAAPPPSQDLAAVAYQAARLAVLEERRQRLEGQLVDARVRMQLGENHPQVQALRAQLADAERQLTAAGTEWIERDINRLAQVKADLERDIDQMLTMDKLGQQHPRVLSRSRELQVVEQEMSDAAGRLLAQTEGSLREQIKKGQGGLDPYLRLARLYELNGQSAEAQRVIGDGLAWMRIARR